MTATKRLTLSKAIERQPDKVSGAWLFRATRVPVTALLENLKDGASIDQFLEWFPGVTHEQIAAVLDDKLSKLDERAKVKNPDI